MTNVEKVRCTKCGTVYFRFGYPAYTECPECGSLDREPVLAEAVCSTCHGTGKIMTNSVQIPEFDGVDTDNKAQRVTDMLYEREQKKGGENPCRMCLKSLSMIWRRKK